MGRTTKLTDDVLATLCECITLGMSWEQSAEVAGVTDRVVRMWRASKPSVVSALKKAELSGMQRRLRRIELAGISANWQADAWWLERRYPDQWGKRERMDVNHTGTLDIRQVVRGVQAAIDAVVEDGETRQRLAAKLLELDAGATNGESAE